MIKLKSVKPNSKIYRSKYILHVFLLIKLIFQISNLTNNFFVVQNWNVENQMSDFESCPPAALVLACWNRVLT